MHDVVNNPMPPHPMERAQGPYTAGDSRIEGLEEEKEKLAKSANLWLPCEIDKSPGDTRDEEF